MLSFRKKVLIGDFLIFIIILGCLFPFIGKTVRNITEQSLEERANDLISDIKNVSSTSSMVDLLRSQESYSFYRVTLIYDDKILYDSHAYKTVYQESSKEDILSQKEVTKAKKEGQGYGERFSDLFNQPFAYVATSFDFEGKTYILRVGFPFKHIKQLIKDFEVGFLLFATLILFIYGVMIWVLVHRFTRPIQTIISVIKTKQDQHYNVLPKIEFGKTINPKDDFGRLATILNSMSDRIKKQIQKLTDQRNENEAILETLLEGVIALDINNKITYINEIALHYLKIDKMVINNSLENLIKENFSKLLIMCKNLVAFSLKQKKVLTESIVIGTSNKIYLNIIVMPREKNKGTVIVLQDKTADTKVIEMGKDFIANASHELRTPITIIRGFAETLQDIPNISEDLLKEITQKIVRTSDRLNNLVQSLLKLTNIENLSRSDFSQCDLETILKDLSQQLQAIYKNVKIKLTLSSVKVFCEKSLIELAIMNILDNAVKYSEGTPEIFVELTKENNMALISIQDNGMGIPDEDIEHIFDRFYTVDKARSRKLGGAGLGLSIVKSIVDKHKGNIEVLSEGRGTLFKIKLPIRSF